jgi:RecA-family ATPase
MTLEWPTVAIPHDSPPLEAVPPQRQGLASELLSPKQLKDLPPVRPLIEDTIPLGGVSLLAGRFSTAKSFMALSMALSVATGSPWYGKRSRQETDALRGC